MTSGEERKHNSMMTGECNSLPINRRGGTSENGGMHSQGVLEFILESICPLDDYSYLKCMFLLLQQHKYNL